MYHTQYFLNGELLYFTWTNRGPKVGDKKYYRGKWFSIIHIERDGEFKPLGHNEVAAILMEIES
jgi:hypothetical protein